MKANEYIKENGLAEARKLLEMGRGFVKLSDDGSFHTDELKRLVESHELVGVYGGLDGAKKKLNSLCIFRWITPEITALEKAIADVEACQ